jgi:hypothetical protein
MITINRKNPTSGEVTSSLVNASDSAGLHFNGTSGNIDIASPPDLGTKFSFEFVVQADSIPASGYSYLTDFGNGGRFAITVINEELAIYDTYEREFSGATFLSDLKVHHVVVTVDGTSAIAYDNGNQVGTLTIAASNIDSCSDAKIGSRFDGTPFFDGTFYRCRFWNKTLSQPEVTSVYESASIDFADQYGSQTDKTTNGTFASDTGWTKGTGWTITGGNAVATAAGDGSQIYQVVTGLTIGKRYRMSLTVNGFTDGSVNAYFAEAGQPGVTTPTLTGTGTATIEGVATGTSQYVSVVSRTAASDFTVSEITLNEIGCVSDYDLSYAQPEISTIVQNRSGSGDATAVGGVTQITAIEQLNSKSARIGTTAATPADGDLLVSGNVGVGVVPAATVADYTALEMGGLTNISAKTGAAVAGNPTVISNNAFIDANNFNTGWKRLIEAACSQHLMVDGTHKLRVAGTAVTTGAITWTDALTIDSAGLVQVASTPSDTVGTVGFSLKDAGNAIEFGLRLDAANKDLHIDRYYAGAWHGPVITFDRSSGNVGIGATPTDPDGYSTALNVKGGSATNGAAIYLGNTANENSLRLSNWSGTGYVTVRGAYPLYIGTNNTTRVTIDGTSGLATFSAGIAFQSATTGTGTTASGYTLDAYEVGTFTPTVTSATGTITTASATGTYTRVGRVVSATYDITVTTNGTGAGTLNATLPFTGSANNSYAIGREVTAVGFSITGTIGTGLVSLVKTSNDLYPAADGYRLKCSTVYQAA